MMYKPIFQGIIRHKFFRYTIPYISYFLILCGVILFLHTGQLYSMTAIVAAFMIFSALLMLGAHFWSCFTIPEKTERREAQFTLIISTCIYAAMLIIAESILPPFDCKYTETQRFIQKQLKRRNVDHEKPYRNITIKNLYNDLGWPGKNLNKTRGANKIVFIGDSFLEKKSTKNLSQISEEILKSKKNTTEVITLSEAGMGPEQYRFLLYEFALNMKAKHIYIFFYEANDLVPYFVFTPYKHLDFSMTTNAYKIIETLSLPPEVQRMLYKEMKYKNVYHSKRDLYDKLDRFNLDINQKALIYLACYGYSCNKTGMPLFPKLFDSLKNISFKKIFQKNSNIPPTWESIYPQYKTIFTSPENERLEKIAKLLAYDYLGLDDYKPCFDLLRKQDPYFISYLIKQVDMIYYFVTAVRHAITNNVPDQGWTLKAEKLNKVIHEYLKLIQEMKLTAQSQGILLTLVFIPEASYVDENFRQFWKPMLDFQKQFKIQHDIYTSLKSNLLGKIEVIDFGQYPEKFSNGYWKFDGHWNEKGNRNAAEILAEYIISQQKVTKKRDTKLKEDKSKDEHKTIFR
jgi:hypothetical protein